MTSFHFLPAVDAPASGPEWVTDDHLAEAVRHVLPSVPLERGSVVRLSTPYGGRVLALMHPPAPARPVLLEIRAFDLANPDAAAEAILAEAQRFASDVSGDD